NKGSIEVGMFVEDEQLYFYVEDTGIGIAADKIPIIFNAYESMDSISQSKGTGLGMAICIAVMRLMGGTVGVYSEVGIGSLFWCSHKPPMLRAKLKEDADNISLQLIKDKIHKSYLLK
ncbi:MAG: ATP-binding protein, partial [Bacteroidaceae bacterium]